MSKRYRLLFLIGAFILIAALAVWPGRWSASAYANVTLVSFMATTAPGIPNIDIEWETATEINTAGFFITRSDSAGGTYQRMSDFIPHLGNDIVGSPYGWTDGNTVLNRTYWYKLEEVTTSQESIFYGPISATAGVSVTNTPMTTPTRTPTRTPTLTPSSMPTSTARPKATSAEPTESISNIVITPRIAIGATITPQSASSIGSTNPEPLAATPTLASLVTNSQPISVIATSEPAASNVATVVASALPASAPPPVVADAVQMTGAISSPTDAAPAADAPAIVVTESALSTSSTGTGASPALILAAAAFLFLGIAFVILRQARQ